MNKHNSPHGIRRTNELSFPQNNIVGNKTSKKREEIKPEQLHEWYLEATCEINPAHYNSRAQKPYSELKEGQKFIDKYIADKCNQALTNAKQEGREEALAEASDEADNHKFKCRECDEYHEHAGEHFKKVHTHGDGRFDYVCHHNDYCRCTN